MEDKRVIIREKAGDLRLRARRLFWLTLMFQKSSEQPSMKMVMGYLFNSVAAV